MEVTRQLVETGWFHAENFIWLFDASGSGWNSKPGIAKALQFNVQKIIPAQQYTLLNKGSRIALMLPQASVLHRQKSKDHWRAANPGMVMSATDLPVTGAELNHPPAIITRIEGQINDVAREYNPRRFAINLLTLDPQNPYQNAIALYRNINAIPLTRAGNVSGSLRREKTAPFAWALLTLTIAIPDEPDLVLKTQANQFGDFVFSLTELPALETDSLIAGYNATLGLHSCAVVDGIPDPDQLTIVQVKRIADGNDFVNAVNLTIVPGEQHVLKSQGESALVIKTSV